MLTFNQKIVKILTIFSVLFIFICNNSYALVSQSYEFFVNDTANILSYDTKEYIINMNKSLESKSGAQIVVVTVTSLDGLEIEDYATQLFRQYGIGNKSKNNGILFLVSTGERRVRIEVGYGLEGCLPDGKTGRILDNYVVPYLKNNDWDNGIKNGFNAILEEVSKEYNITVDGSIAAVGNYTGLSDGESTALGFIVPLLIISVFARFKLKNNSSKLAFAGRSNYIYNDSTMRCRWRNYFTCNVSCIKHYDYCI